jgi:acetyl-CoA C-acetyltransferase
MGGYVDCAIAGGITAFDAMPIDGFHDAFSGQHSGWHTEHLVAEYRITRADQDAWALRSQQNFYAAQTGGKLNVEIVPVEVKGRKGPE